MMKKNKLKKKAKVKENGGGAKVTTPVISH